MAELTYGEPVTEAVSGRSLWADARIRLFHNRAAVVSMIILSIIVLLAIFGPSFSPYEYDDIDFDRIGEGPDWASWHIFGSDRNGRDLFLRVMHGSRTSLLIGIVATLVSLVIGVAWGSIAGFIGGKVDAIMMRFVDILYSVPFTFFIILLTVAFGRNFLLIFVAIGAVSWLDMARIVRGQTLQLRRKEFIEACHATGISTFKIIARHIIPNLMGPVIIYMTLTIPSVILTESFISYFGLGVQEPATSWGALISEGAVVMESQPWALFFPALFLAVALFCFNFIGDGLRDALDPKDR